MTGPALSASTAHWHDVEVRRAHIGQSACCSTSRYRLVAGKWLCRHAGAEGRVQHPRTGAGAEPGIPIHSFAEPAGCGGHARERAGHLLNPYFLQFARVADRSASSSTVRLEFMPPNSVRCCADAGWKNDFVFLDSLRPWLCLRVWTGKTGFSRWTMLLGSGTTRDRGVLRRSDPASRTRTKQADWLVGSAALASRLPWTIPSNLRPGCSGHKVFSIRALESWVRTSAISAKPRRLGPVGSPSVYARDPGPFCPVR